jgi:hypothetical protein
MEQQNYISEAQATALRETTFVQTCKAAGLQAERFPWALATYRAKKASVIQKTKEAYVAMGGELPA